MSIQTELTRITNAKSAIKTAIEGKGVTVPAGTLLDGMAALIESIEAGGGSGGDLSAIGVSKMDSGTITIASGISVLTIVNQLGVIPKIIFVYTKDYGVVLSYGNRAIESVFGVVFEDTDGDSQVIRQITGKGNVSWTILASLYSGISQGGFTSADGSNKVCGFYNVSENLIECSYKDGGGNSCYFVDGATYEWLALA